MRLNDRQFICVLSFHLLSLVTSVFVLMLRFIAEQPVRARSFFDSLRAETLSTFNQWLASLRNSHSDYILRVMISFQNIYFLISLVVQVHLSTLHFNRIEASMLLFMMESMFTPCIKIYLFFIKKNRIIFRMILNCSEKLAVVHRFQS